ncbi:hypothetical protein DVDV_0497 [Desulfovibrio sp. DV]|nr:hypothetical protein DVDV_0497 [Desulfovibrio sp. DV]
MIERSCCAGRTDGKKREKEEAKGQDRRPELVHGGGSKAAMAAAAV